MTPQEIAVLRLAIIEKLCRLKLTESNEEEQQILRNLLVKLR